MPTVEKTRKTIPIIKPLMDEREADAARRAILSGWVTQGPEVAAFEQEFAAYVGSKHACAVSNCTTALHLALLAVGVQAGDEVITVSHSFIATANAIRYCGALPVFVDIERESMNISPRRVEEAITPKTRAILLVHQVGMPCDLAALLKIARARKLALIEDAACAIGSEILWDGRWEKIGKPHGDVACFSFHPRKIVTTGDGGMLTTNNPDCDQKFKLWRQHSMSMPDTVRHNSPTVVFESYPVLGFNYRMTDIQAAVGREQLKRLPDVFARRRELAERYHALLEDMTSVTPPHEPAWSRSNFQSYCVRLADHLDQKSVMQRLLDAGIASRRGVMCSHREQAYASEPCRWDDLRESEAAQDHCILLPLFHQMTTMEQDEVVAALREATRA